MHHPTFTEDLFLVHIKTCTEAQRSGLSATIASTMTGPTVIICQLTRSRNGIYATLRWIMRIIMYIYLYYVCTCLHIIIMDLISALKILLTPKGTYNGPSRQCSGFLSLRQPNALPQPQHFVVHRDENYYW